MRFPADTQLHLLCAKKSQNHRFPCVTLRDGWLYATDNRVLCAVKTDAVGQRVTNIDPEAIKAARKHTKKGETAWVQVDESTGLAEIPGGPSFREPKASPVPAPPQLESLEPAPIDRIGFNGKFLGELSRALGCDQLYMLFHENVILVRCVDNDGRIMEDRYGLVHPVEPCVEA